MTRIPKCDGLHLWPPILLYMLAQAASLALLVMHLSLGQWGPGSLLLGAWLLQGAGQGAAYLWRQGGGQSLQAAASFFLLLTFSPLVIAGDCIQGLVKGSSSAEFGGASYHRWRSVLAGGPLTLTIQGAVILCHWNLVQNASLLSVLSLASLVLSLADLVLTSATWQHTARETRPLVWYRPVEEEGRKGTFLERVLTAVSTVLQVEYGATEPGGLSRLPMVGKADQRVVVKRRGLPSLLHLPRAGEVLPSLPPTLLALAGRLATLVLLAAYWQGYTLIPVVITLGLSTVLAAKLLHLPPEDALASSILSLGSPSSYRAQSSPPAPTAANFSLLSSSLNLLSSLICFAILLSTLPSPSPDTPLPFLSCYNSSSNLSTSSDSSFVDFSSSSSSSTTTLELTSRACSEGETPHQVLSISLGVLILLALLSLLQAHLARKRGQRCLVVVPRVWSERQRCYKDPSGKDDLTARHWRLASATEVKERRLELLLHLQNKTINVFRLSRCQGLSVPHCKLQDGVILPKLAFQVENDLETLTSTEEEFRTFDNLYGLRFTRYVVMIKDNK